jgi:hypothetical protein
VTTETHSDAVDTPSGLPRSVNTAIGLGLLIGTILVILVFSVGHSYFEGKKFEKLKENKYARIRPDRALEEQRARTILESYAWVDQEKGVVRVPIERAMELVALEAGSR